MPDLRDPLPPPGGRRRGYTPTTPPDAVYFPACVNALFGTQDSGTNSAVSPSDAVFRLADLAGISLRVPDQITGLCCGTPWESKGLVRGHDAMSQMTGAALLAATDGGRLPVVVDASSCAHALRRLDPRTYPIQAVDLVTFVRNRILPVIEVPHRLKRIVVHPTCSAVHLVNVDDLLAVARACADEVDVPSEWGCCGFAGDRGLLHPELTAAATHVQAGEIRARNYDAYVSHNRTCEMAMSRATGERYEHIVQLLAFLATGSAQPVNR
jgi:D-lactate dehydrogenase